jgi:hypothetical protein
MRITTWRGRLKREMNETTSALLAAGRIDDAAKHAQFADLMRKSIDVDWGFILIVTGLSFIVFALVTRIVLRFLGYSVD